MRTLAPATNRLPVASLTIESASGPGLAIGARRAAHCEVGGDELPHWMKAPVSSSSQPIQETASTGGTSGASTMTALHRLLPNRKWRLLFEH